MRSLQIVIFEAIVIGIMNLMFFYGLSIFIKNPIITLFITGALIHLVFEYLGLNWYIKDKFSLPTIASDSNLFGVLGLGVEFIFE